MMMCNFQPNLHILPLVSFHKKLLRASLHIPRGNLAGIFSKKIPPENPAKFLKNLTKLDLYYIPHFRSCQ